MTGWTFEEVDNAPAVRSDWLLHIAAAKAEVQAEKERANGK